MSRVEQPNDWPCCPRCGHHRQTVCPFCKVAGDRLPLGDVVSPPGQEDAQEAVDEYSVLLCPTCDEPIPPQFFRHCESCGFDFGSGLEIPAINEHVEQLTHRAIWVLAGLIAFSFASFAYFAWVLGD
jgi:hypothetical protein